MILGKCCCYWSKKYLKRLLAYSSISHMGYALAGVATGAVSGYTSTIIYITIYCYEFEVLCLFIFNEN